MQKPLLKKPIKGTPIRKTRDLEEIEDYKMDIEKEETNNKDYLNMKLKLKELSEQNKKLTKDEDNLKKKYEKAMQQGDLRHITSSFNAQKMHMEKKNKSIRKFIRCKHKKF